MLKSIARIIRRNLDFKNKSIDYSRLLSYLCIKLFFSFIPDKSYFVGIVFKAYREMRNNSGDLNLGTKVINAVVSPRPSDELEDPVEMTFKKNIVSIRSSNVISNTRINHEDVFKKGIFL